MVSKRKDDATNNTGKDTQTEVSNNNNGSAPITMPEKTKGMDKQEKIEQTHEQVTDDIMHHPDLVSPLDDTRVYVKSGFGKDSERLKKISTSILTTS